MSIPSQGPKGPHGPTDEDESDDSKGSAGSAESLEPSEPESESELGSESEDSLDLPFSQLANLSPYLSQVFSLKEAAFKHTKDKYKKTDDFERLPKNIQKEIERLSNNLSTDPEELKMVTDFWKQMEDSKNPIGFMKTHKTPDLLEELSTLVGFQELSSTVEKNQSSAKFWLRMVNRLESFSDTLGIFGNSIKFPPFDIIVGFISNTVKMAQKFSQWRASKKDPLALGPKNLFMGMSVMDVVAVASSVIGLSALANSLITTGSFAVTGAALAPISLFIYAAVSAADKLLTLGKSVFDLYKEIKQKEPANTYALRVQKRMVDVVNNAAHVAFKVLLAIVAFTAIANPLGLSIAGAAIISTAVVITVIGGLSLWMKKNLSNKIQNMDKKVLGALEEAEVPLLGKRPKVSPKVEPRQERQQRQLLTNYEDVSRPKTNLLWKDHNINPDTLRKDIAAAGQKFGMKLSSIPDKRRAETFKILKETDEGELKEIASVQCRKDIVRYQLPPAKEHDTAHRKEIQALLKSIENNTPDTLSLKGGAAREILFIYETALDMGITKISLDPKAKERVNKLHAAELKKLEERQFAIIAEKQARGKDQRPMPKF